MLVISARLAPLPPSKSRSSFLPSRNNQTGLFCVDTFETSSTMELFFGYFCANQDSNLRVLSQLNPPLARATALSNYVYTVTTSLELVLDLDRAYNPAAQRDEAARILDYDQSRITEIRIRKRSLDARGQIRVRLLCDVWL